MNSVNNEEFRLQELAHFLKTRRAKISPAQAGLSSASRRRTPGLRREEVSQLAGIGLTWYTWLEQGRNIHVSAQVIDSLSRVLLLSGQERTYLYRLANQPLPSEIPEYKPDLSPILQHVLDNLVVCPSFIADQRWNIIAWNQAACLVFGDFNKMSDRQRNIVWGMFTDDYYKELYVDWEPHAKSLVGRFRSTCGKYIEDTWFIELISDLNARSPEFRLWWSLHDITDDSGVYKQLKHPAAGVLDFASSCFDVSDNSGFKLFVHVPLAATDTALKMRDLLDEGEGVREQGC